MASTNRIALRAVIALVAVAVVVGHLVTDKPGFFGLMGIAGLLAVVWEILKGRSPDEEED